MSQYYCISLSRLGVPGLEPLQAIGTIQALPRPPSTRLGATHLYILFHCFVGLTFSPLGTVFPAFIVNTVFNLLLSSFLVKLIVLCKANKRGHVAAGDRALVEK